MLAFAGSEPQLMAQPAIGPVPVSLVIATAMIAFAVGLTGLYVILANRASR